MVRVSAAAVNVISGARTNTSGLVCHRILPRHLPSLPTFCCLICVVLASPGRSIGKASGWRSAFVSGPDGPAAADPRSRIARRGVADRLTGRIDQARLVSYTGVAIIGFHERELRGCSKT